MSDWKATCRLHRKLPIFLILLSPEVLHKVCPLYVNETTSLQMYNRLLAILWHLNLLHGIRWYWQLLTDLLMARLLDPSQRNLFHQFPLVSIVAIGLREPYAQMKVSKFCDVWCWIEDTWQWVKFSCDFMMRLKYLEYVFRFRIMNNTWTDIRQ